MTRKMPSGKNWQRRIVAGPTALDDEVWDSKGKMQLDFLLKQGLLPHHTFLEVGCGALRGGRHFIRYLDEGNYFAVDKEKVLVDAGVKAELEGTALMDKTPTFGISPNADLSFIDPDVRFDFAWSMAVFIHIPPEAIKEIVAAVSKRLKPDGRFYATFHRSKDGEIHLSRPLDRHNWWRKREHWGAKYPMSFIEEVAGAHKLKANYIGRWGHNANKDDLQVMLEFVKEEESADLF